MGPRDEGCPCGADFFPRDAREQPEERPSHDEERDGDGLDRDGDEHDAGPSQALRGEGEDGQRAGRTRGGEAEVVARAGIDAEGRFEAARGQHRNQEQRGDERGDLGEDDGERHVAEHLAGHALDEDDGKEHRNGGERGGDDGHADFAGAADDGGDVIVALLATAKDAFEHDDGVVDEVADAEGEAAERDDV